MGDGGKHQATPDPRNLSAGLSRAATRGALEAADPCQKSLIYQKATAIEVGLLIKFGESVKVKRKVFDHFQHISKKLGPLVSGCPDAKGKKSFREIREIRAKRKVNET